MDVLADLLTRARARGALFARSTLRAPWGLELEDRHVPLSVHAVLAGQLWAQVDGLAPQRFLQGDLFLVRSDAPYRFVHEPGAATRSLSDVLASGDGSRVHALGGGAARALGSPMAPAELVSDRRAHDMRYAPAHARAVARNLARRARERVIAPR